MAIDRAHDSVSSDSVSSGGLPSGGGGASRGLSSGVVSSGPDPIDAGRRRPVARLFVSADSAASVFALATLRAVVAELPAAAVPEVIVVDVTREQVLAFEHQVYVTPNLVVTVPTDDGTGATGTMTDGLTDRGRVAAFLLGVGA